MRGSIVERNGFYSVVISYKDPLTGDWKQSWTKAGTSIRKAELLRTKLLTQAAGGAIAKPGRVTLGDHLNNWLKDVSIQTLAPTTLSNYEYSVNKYILPALSRIPLTGLTPTHISNFYATILQPDGGKVRTVQVIHHILHESLDYAVKHGLIIRNPINQVDPPKGKRREIKTLTANEIILALQMAKSSVFYPMFHVDIFVGLRRAELIGLKWGDIDLLLSKISIQRGISKITYGSNKGKTIVKPPKTAKGKRLIPITASTCEVLRQHYEKQKQFRNSLDMELTDDDYVFCNHLGQPYAPHTISTAWRRVAQKSGIKNVSLHGLRHTFATMLFRDGVHPKIVSELLGHATTAITMDLYSHITPTMLSSAVSKLDDLIFGSLTDSLASH